VPSPPCPPGWLAPIERLVLAAARDVRMLAVLTPLDARRERERLVADLRAGRQATPRWTYARDEHDDLRRALDAAERALAREPARSIAALYLGRVRELVLEAALCAAAGTAELARVAAERFASAGGAEAHTASELCALWLAEAAPTSAGPVSESDAATPRSLLSLMRTAVGQAGLPFQVVPALWPRSQRPVSAPSMSPPGGASPTKMRRAPYCTRSKVTRGPGYELLPPVRCSFA